MMRFLLLAGVFVVCTTDAFTSCQVYGKQRTTAFKSKNTPVAYDDIVKTSTATYEATLSEQRRRPSRLRRIFSKDTSNQTSEVCSFTYDYDVMEIGSPAFKSSVTDVDIVNTTTAVMLIHPIGVGIGEYGSSIYFIWPKQTWLTNFILNHHF